MAEEADNESKLHFDIRVALIGNVSVGKSTILNAILKKHYSPTSIRRETSVITEFHAVYDLINPYQSTTPRKRPAESVDESTLPSEQQRRDERTDRTIHDELKRWNEERRQGGPNESPIVVRREVKVKKPFLGEMRKDASLTLIDIPGLNENDFGVKFTEWVREKWSSFDCALVVMDAEQGMNTGHQQDLLNLVRDCLKVREIPVIVLCNKVDTFEEDKDLKKMVEEINDAVKKTLAEYDFEFVSLSARFALVYYCARDERREEFEQLPFELIEKFGLTEIGKSRWKNLKTREDKVDAAYMEMKNKELFHMRLRDTNFDAVHDKLSQTVCGIETQTKLINAQLDYQLRLPLPDNAMAIVHEICAKKAALQQPFDTVQTFFWRCYKVTKKEAFDKLTTPDRVHFLEKPLTYLKEYHIFAKSRGWKKQENKVEEMMIDLIHDQIGLVLARFDDFIEVNKRELNDVMELDEERRHGRPRTWDKISAGDWEDIIDSILQVSFSEYFLGRLGLEYKAVLKVSRVLGTLNTKATTNTSQMIEGTRMSLRESHHWGHLIYEFGEFMKTKKAKSG